MNSLLDLSSASALIARLEHHVPPILAAACVPAFVTSALAFAGGTLPSGAWAAHPIAYLSLVLVFLPVAVLWLTYLLPGTDLAAP